MNLACLVIGSRDTPTTLAPAAAKSLESTYEAPLLAHATMEPMNCVADVRPDRCEIWAPHQAPDWARNEVAGALGMTPEQVTVHTTLLGGGFGRRFLPEELIEAAQVSRLAGVPVKLVFTREDDMQRDWYRPMSVHRMAGGVNARGDVTGWLHRVVAPSISNQRWPGSVKNALDLDAVDGAADLRYDIPNLRVEYGMVTTPVPVSCGARSMPRRPALPTSASSMSWRRPPAGIRSRFASSCSPSRRGTLRS